MKKKTKSHDDDWICGNCKESYNGDVKKKKNVKKWVQCSFCLMPYHVTCQLYNDEDDDIFMCDKCCELSDNSSEQ